MGSKKSEIWIAVPSDTAPRATRLLKGNLKQVESALRGEWEIRVATVDEAHSMADVGIEDCTREP